MSGSFRKLVENGSIWKLCIAGACIPLTAAVARATIQYKLEKQEYYTEAIKLLKEYKVLDDFLGEPWHALWINRGITSSTKILEDRVALEFPVKGWKDRGIVHVRATKSSDRWVIDQMDIKLKKTKKEWTFYQKGNSTVQFVE